MLELIGFHSQMILYKHNLIDVDRVPDNNLLNTPRISHLKYMHSLCHFKWHYAVRHIVYMLLLRFRFHIDSAE